MSLHVIAIGPQGGKIVGYHHGDLKHPIYAGSAEAHKLELQHPHGSPAASAGDHGVHVSIHPTRHDTAMATWKHDQAPQAKEWLAKHGGAAALPKGTEVHKTSSHTVLHVPRDWAEKSTTAEKTGSGIGVQVAGPHAVPQAAAALKAAAIGSTATLHDSEGKPHTFAKTGDDTWEAGGGWEGPGYALAGFVVDDSDGKMTITPPAAAPAKVWTKAELKAALLSAPVGSTATVDFNDGDGPTAYVKQEASDKPSHDKWVSAGGEASSSVLGVVILSSDGKLEIAPPKTKAEILAEWKAKLTEAPTGTKVEFTAPNGMKASVTKNTDGDWWEPGHHPAAETATIASAVTWGTGDAVVTLPTAIPAPKPVAAPPAPAPPAAATTTAKKPKLKKTSTPVEVHKASLKTWGVQHWHASARHPVNTPEGAGYLLGHVVAHGNHDMTTGHVWVEMEDGTEKQFMTSAVSPQEGAPLQAPWAHPGVKAWAIPEVKETLDGLLAQKLTTEGGSPLMHSGADVFNALADEGVPCFVIGGTIRDAIQGKKGKDIDFSFGGTGAQGARGAAKKLGLPLAQHSANSLGNPSGLVEFGHDDKDKDEGKVQGKGFAGLGSGTKAKIPPPAIRGSDMRSDAMSHDFTCNTLFYDHKNGVILDPLGTGVQDALSQTLRFPIPQAQWADWLQRNPNNVGRYYKFRDRGYQPADQAHVDFMKSEGKKHVEAGNLPGFAMAQLKAAKKHVIADFGQAWYDQHVK